MYSVSGDPSMSNYFAKRRARHQREMAEQRAQDWKIGVYPYKDPTQKERTAVQAVHAEPVKQPVQAVQAVQSSVGRARHRVTLSDHEAHNLDYFLDKYDFPATISLNQDYYVRVFRYVGSAFLSHNLLLEVVMAQMPELLQGRVQVVRTLIEVDIDGSGVLVARKRAPRRAPRGFVAEIPRSAVPQVIHVLLTTPLLTAFDRGFQHSEGGHANVVYVNPGQREIELFEPHGAALWTYDVVEAIRASGILPEYQYSVPSATCPVARRQRQNTGPQTKLGLCAQYSQMYALYRVLNPGVSGQQLNQWLQRGGPKAALKRFNQIWAWVTDHLRRTNPAEYKRVFVEPGFALNTRYEDMREMAKLARQDSRMPQERPAFAYKHTYLV